MIDWRLGLKWFDQCLIDADKANNSFGWQWIAGCGYDAVPYFRIFNPLRQSLKYDPSSEYISLWLPELKCLPPKYKHSPNLLSVNSHSDYKFNLERDYYREIVSHDQARNETLENYRLLKKEILNAKI